MAETEFRIAVKHPELIPIDRSVKLLHGTYFAAAIGLGVTLIYVFSSAWAPAYFLAHPGLYGTTAGLVLVVVLLAVLCQLLQAWSSGEIVVSRDGISLPPLLSRVSDVGAWLSWTSLNAATVAGADDHRSLLLQMGPAKSLTLPLVGMEANSLEQLLLSIELWGTGCTRSSELIEYQAELHNKNKGLGQLSYTDMWNEELGRRFASTTFVPLEPGAKLQSGRLTVVKQLAFGGLSAIYLVKNSQGDALVVKEAVVPAGMEVRNQDAAEKALQREASILSQLNHPGVVQVLDHFIDSGQHYLVLQHVVGQDLRQMVRQNGPQSEVKVLDWAVQISSALEYLHNWEPPIIHRDLTPENIVLKNDGTIIIIDFGASNQFLGTMTGTIVGKQAYMSPEQLQGRATTASDVYSFGGTLFFLLTGKDPVPLSESKPNQINENVSDELSQLVAFCTSYDAQNRPASMKDVRESLTKLYSTHGIAKLFTESDAESTST